MKPKQTMGRTFKTHRTRRTNKDKGREIKVKDKKDTENQSSRTADP